MKHVSTLCLALCISSLGYAETSQKTRIEQTDFTTIRRQVYAVDEAYGDIQNLPKLRGAGNYEVIKAFLGHISARIRHSMVRTLESRSSTKEPSTKLFHPMGVCTEGIWRISEDNPYSGLLQRGTRVPAIVRMSTGGDNVTPEPEFRQYRNFALAVKLFPSTNLDQPVLPRNVLTFDQNGLDGNSSPWFLRNDASDARSTQFFTNWMFGGNFISKGFTRLFSFFSANPRLRSLKPVASVTSENQIVARPRMPVFIKFVPKARWTSPQQDFRTELLQYGPGEIVFKIVTVGEIEAESIKKSNTSDHSEIGELVLGRPVVSEFCDKQLHFSHSED